MFKYMDAHIHLDQYEEKHLNGILLNKKLEGVITVSNDLQSCIRNIELAKQHRKVHTALGFHPEQPLLPEREMEEIFQYIDDHHQEIVAIGEVGLPYYLEQSGKVMNKNKYLYYLEWFIKVAAELNKPIQLHAVYDDAPIVCDLLEKHEVKKAHFHWFKGSEETIERMINNGYYVSITPDILYKDRTKMLVKKYPLSFLMVETDGPWEYDGPLKGRFTEPTMMEGIIKEIAIIKTLPAEEVAQILLHNTNSFYNLS